MPSKWTAYDAPSDVPTDPGCYAVYLNGDLVYVGQSMNVRRRLREKNRFMPSRYSANFETPWGMGRLKIKVRSSVKYGDWAMVELRLLRRLKPRGNTAGC